MLHSKRHKIHIITSLLFAVFSLNCHAEFKDGCDDKKTTNLSYLRCLDTKISVEKRSVVTWQNKIKIDLEKKQNQTGNTQLIKIFKRAEQEFEKYTEANCRWRYLNLLPDTIAASISYKRCELFTLKQHIVLLKFD